MNKLYIWKMLFYLLYNISVINIFILWFIIISIINVNLLPYFDIGLNNSLFTIFISTFHILLIDDFDLNRFIFNSNKFLNLVKIFFDIQTNCKFLDKREYVQNLMIHLFLQRSKIQYSGF